MSRYPWYPKKIGRHVKLKRNFLTPYQKSAKG